jgi:hypothetical protein
VNKKIDAKCGSLMFVGVSNPVGLQFLKKDEPSPIKSAIFSWTLFVNGINNIPSDFTERKM